VQARWRGTPRGSSDSADSKIEEICERLVRVSNIKINVNYFVVPETWKTVGHLEVERQLQTTKKESTI
jgi:hypothetical protein